MVFNAIHHGYFCAAWSVREIRAEISLGQIFHSLGWANYFCTGSASLWSTKGNNCQHKQIYSTVCMNHDEGSSLMSKFGSRRFSAPHLRVKACTRAHCYQSLSTIAWEGFSTYSPANRVTRKQNSMPVICKLLIPKFLNIYFPFLLDWFLRARLYKLCTKVTN